MIRCVRLLLAWGVVTTLGDPSGKPDICGILGSFFFSLNISYAYVRADRSADPDVRHVRAGGADGVDLRVRLRGHERVGGEDRPLGRPANTPYQVLQEAQSHQDARGEKKRRGGRNHCKEKRNGKCIEQTRRTNRIWQEIAGKEES